MARLIAASSERGRHRPDVRRSDLVAGLAGLSPFEQPINERNDVLRTRDHKMPRNGLSTVQVSDIQLHFASAPQCESPSPHTIEEVQPHDGITARTFWVLSRLALDPLSPEYSLVRGDPPSEHWREVGICHLASNPSMFGADDTEPPLACRADAAGSTGFATGVQPCGRLTPPPPGAASHPPAGSSRSGRDRGVPLRTGRPEASRPRTGCRDRSVAAGPRSRPHW